MRGNTAPNPELLVGLFDALLSGSPTEEIQSALDRLPDAYRQYFLCTACDMREEVAANCIARANEMDALLNCACPHYFNGVRSCVRARLASA